MDIMETYFPISKKPRLLFHAYNSRNITSYKKYLILTYNYYSASLILTFDEKTSIASLADFNRPTI